MHRSLHSSLALRTRPRFVPVLVLIFSFPDNSNRPQVVARSHKASSTASTRTRRDIRRRWGALWRRAVLSRSRRRNGGGSGRGARRRMRAFVSGGSSSSSSGAGVGGGSSSLSSSDRRRRRPGLASCYAIVILLLLLLLLLLHEAVTAAVILGSRCGRTNTHFIVGPRKPPRPSGDARFLLHR